MALPIGTGKPVPPGYDCLIVNEHARVIEGMLHLAEPIERGRNIRLRGEDGFVGDIIVKAGDIIRPAAIGALISLGVEEVEIKQRSRFALLPTGDELQDNCGESARVYDANGPMIAASLRYAGIDGSLLPPAPGDEDFLRSRVAELVAIEDADIVITTGGISAGSRDIIPRLIEEQGGQFIFMASPCVRESLCYSQPSLTVAPSSDYLAIPSRRSWVVDSLYSMLFG